MYPLIKVLVDSYAFRHVLVQGVDRDDLDLYPVQPGTYEFKV